jgi:hypothetical protein
MLGAAAMSSPRASEIQAWLRTASSITSFSSGVPLSARLGWTVEVVRHPPRPRGEWVPHGDLSDERRVYFTRERLPPAPRVFRGVLARRWVADKLFVCLHRDDIEPTNNGSGRDLRNSVVHDTVTAG